MGGIKKIRKGIPDVKKRDFIIMIFMAMIAVISMITIKMTEKEGDRVIIYHDQIEYKNVSLHQNQMIKIPTHTGYNEVKIAEGKVWMIEADCPDQICVHHRKISNVGETIVCLPNKIIVEIKGEQVKKMDSIAK